MITVECDVCHFIAPLCSNVGALEHLRVEQVCHCWCEAASVEDVLRDVAVRRLRAISLLRRVVVVGRDVVGRDVVDGFPMIQRRSDRRLTGELADRIRSSV